MTLSDDGSLLAGPGGDGRILVTDLAGKTPDRSIAARGRYFSLAFSPDGHYVAVGGEGVIDIVDLASGHAVLTIGDERPGHRISRLAFSPDNGTLASYGTGGTTLWDIRLVGQPLPGHSGDHRVLKAPPN